jgi:hypothetical protein
MSVGVLHLKKINLLLWRAMKLGGNSVSPTIGELSDLVPYYRNQGPLL